MMDPKTAYTELKSEFASIRFPPLECGVGWIPVLHRACMDIVALGPPHDAFEFVQIKQKLGTLRAYTGTITEPAQAIVDRAELESYTVCEWCGGAGLRRNSDWVRTLCQPCYEAASCRTKHGHDPRQWPVPYIPDLEGPLHRATEITGGGWELEPAKAFGELLATGGVSGISALVLSARFDELFSVALAYATDGAIDEFLADVDCTDHLRELCVSERSRRIRDRILDIAQKGKT